VGIEQSPTSRSVKNFIHPQRAIYILGAEDAGLPSKVLDLCQQIVHIETPMCLNVAVAGSIIMFDRSVKLSGG
jgi:tRNA (guanosine-2'-O-)-methyltransferase